MDCKTFRLFLLLFMAVATVQTFTSGVAAQEEPSAFIDPFKPKPIAEKKSAANKGNSSFFPKFSMPKMPKFPKVPNLNPFAKKPNTPPKQTQPKKPNMFQQIGTGTKNFFTKTTHTLMPWTKPKPRPANGAIVPAFMQQERSAERKKKGGIQLMNFFSTDKSNKKVETTNDFFRQERPSFRR